MAHFLKGSFSFLLSQLVGGRNYDKWKKEYYSFKKEVVPNKGLAQELEKACSENGFLRFSEYLRLDQFGEYGYHASHKNHGMTPTYLIWSKTISYLCKKYSIHSILDFGCGDGKLGIETLKEARKHQYDLEWHGIEINTSLHKKILNRLAKEKLKIASLSDSIERIRLPQKTLGLFSYSLDSIPPELFINTSSEKNFPNALIGIRVVDGVLSEHILTEKELIRKQIQIKDGIITVGAGSRTKTFDITSWKLNPYQRALIPISAFSILSDVMESLPRDSLLLIMDEFRLHPHKWQSTHFCLPKDLIKARREYMNIEEIYQEAGESLLYYPFYLQTLLNFLKEIGCNDITYDIEQRKAYTLRDEMWKEKPGLYTVYAIVSFLNGFKKLKTIPLLFPSL